MDQRRTTLVQKTDKWIPAAPALLYCCVIFVMLLLDAVLPSMSDTQYMLFPLLMRIVELISIPCAAFCFIRGLNKDSLRPDAVSVLFMLFALWIALSTLVNGITRDAVFGVPYRYVGVLDLYVFMGAYMFCSRRMQGERSRDSVLLCYMLVADLVAAVFLLDLRFGFIAAFHGKREPAGMFFHGNHYGYFLAVAVMISAGCFLLEKRKKRVLRGACSLALNLLAMAVNRTIGSLLAVGIAMLILIVSEELRSKGKARKPWVLTALFAGIVAMGFILLPSFRRDIAELAGEFAVIVSGTNDIYAGNGRWGIWQYTIRFIAGRPLLGYGCEGISGVLREYTLTGSPHNEVLTYAVFFGIPAAIIYVLGCAAAVIRGIKSSSEDPSARIAAFAAMGYFVSSIFGLAMFYTTPFFFALLGMAASDRDGADV